MSAERRQAPEGGWGELTVDELKSELEARGLTKSGKKDELIARLEEDDATPAAAPVEEARRVLRFTPRAAAVPIRKVLDSAVANAEHNHQLPADNLYVARAFVDEGPTLKRFRPRALGRAYRVNKRTSHITVVVDSREEAS